MSASEHCTISPDCARGLHEASARPCGGPLIREGDPCRFCGDPIQRGPDGLIPCPRCWQPITIGDFKGLMAEAGIDTILTIGAPE